MSFHILVDWGLIPPGGIANPIFFVLGTVQSACAHNSLRSDLYHLNACGNVRLTFPLSYVIDFVFHLFVSYFHVKRLKLWETSWLASLLPLKLFEAFLTRSEFRVAEGANCDFLFYRFRLRF